MRGRGEVEKHADVRGNSDIDETRCERFVSSQAYVFDLAPMEEISYLSREENSEWA